MERDEYGIPKIECETPEEFLRELDDANPRWRGDRWLFRGQNDAKWVLHPRAMRSLLINEFVDEVAAEYPSVSALPAECTSAWKGVKEENFKTKLRLKLHILAEDEIVCCFEQLADQVSLAIPPDRYAILYGDEQPTAFADKLRNVLISKGIGNSSPNRVTYALAQHHGIPTRLMDWTFRPLFAAFFAAHIEQELPKDPCLLVVWAVRSRCLQETSLRLVTHMRSQIGFLQSQDGIFLYDAQADSKFLECGYWQPMEPELRETVAANGVYKLTLPFGERERLLELLRLKYVSKPFLMPSFDNVASEFVDGGLEWRGYLDGLP